MADPVLELRDVTLGIAGAAFVRDISLAISEGQTFGLLGPNGAGKTTLLRAIYGTAEPLAGTVLLRGTARADWRRPAWSRAVGALIQGDGLLTGLTPFDIVDIGLRPLRLPPAEHQKRLTEALTLAGLEDRRDAPADRLSGGEKQRCYFAQLLARAPDLYVLDEPTNHLDLHYQLKLLDEVKRRGKTAIACFHDLAMAKRYCDRVAILEAGRIVAMGPPEEVLSRAQIAKSYRVSAEFRDRALHIDGPL